MAYIPISLPNETPTVVAQVIRQAVEPFLCDVHSMLLLPVPGTSPAVGCNLSIAQILLAAVSGVAAAIYSTVGRSGRVFQDFLIDFYPWNSEPRNINAARDADAARILYEDFRNPLTHSTGTPVFSIENGQRRERRPQAHRLRIDRVAFDSHPGQGLTEDRVNELEAEPVRPAWLPVTLAIDAQLRILTVEALYWGFREAIRVLCLDEERMTAAEEFFSVG